MTRRSLASGTVWLAALAFGARAHAHAVLVDSSVGLEAAILAANVESHLTLHFSPGIEPRRSTLELVPDHGEPRPLPAVFGPGPGDVALTLPKLAAGRYVLRYHVLAADGHVTEGAVPLRVAAPE